MRKLLLTVAMLAGCGGTGSGPQGFTPTPPASDEVQVLSPIIKAIPSGANVTYCSYVPAAFAAQTDVLGFHGGMSLGGHHVVIYIAKKVHPVDTHECTIDDMVNVTYVAGIGADKALNNFGALPDGVAFRVPAGSQLLVQTHWVNASPNAIDGRAFVNLKNAPASASRVPADLLAVVSTNFVVPAGKTATKSTTCPVGEDLHMFFFGGHQHKWGTHFRAEQLAGTASTTLYDHDWVPEYESNPPINIYPKDSPLTVLKGQGLKITCSWDNTSGATDLTFPTDMCATWAFYFPGHGEIDCIDDQWPR